MNRWGAGKRAALSLSVAVAVALAAWPPQAAARGADDLALGVVPQRAIDRDDTRLMRSGGVDSVRAWFNWAAVEGAPGVRDWSSLDSVVEAAAEEGVEPLPYLFGLPQWAANLDGHDCRGGECIPYAPRSALSREAFAEFAGAVVDRYGPGGWYWLDNPEVPYRPIRAWQVWNEMNLRAFFWPEVDAEAYAQLLVATSAAIRAEDPGAEVIVGGMWGGRLAPKRVMPAATYLDRLYAEPGMAEAFDAIALHPYGSKLDAVFQQVRAAVGVTRRNGDGDVGVHITEIGWASGGPRGEGLVKTPRRQAKLLSRAYRRLHRQRFEWNLRSIHWYAWRDTERDQRVCRWCAQSGLRSVEGVPKPAWYAFRRIALR